MTNTEAGLLVFAICSWVLWAMAFRSIVRINGRLNQLIRNIKEVGGKVQ